MFLSAFLIFFAARFSFSVRPGFFAAAFWGDLSDMMGTSPRSSNGAGRGMSAST